MTINQNFLLNDKERLTIQSALKICDELADKADVAIEEVFRCFYEVSKIAGAESFVIKGEYKFEEFFSS